MKKLRFSFAGSLIFALAVCLRAQNDNSQGDDQDQQTNKIVNVGGTLQPGSVRPPLRRLQSPFGASVPIAAAYKPAQIRHAYGFDQLLSKNITGSGQKIAIVDAYGNQNIQSDLNAFCAAFNLPTTTIKVVGRNTGGRGNGWDLETSLDVEWAHATAPGATIILSVASSTSISALLSAVQAAVGAGANVVSMSWGSSEFSSEQSYDSYFTYNGVTFVASSGDSGPGVEWPAASQYVIGVGGTSLYLDSSGNRTAAEIAWTGSGGGLSAYVGRPGYQNNWQTASKRAVPDVCFVADPNTGLNVNCSTYSGGGWFQVGGTSAGAPQWAAAVALANSVNNKALTSPDATLYSDAQGPLTGGLNAIDPLYFFDVTSGDPRAVPGYDQATGVGSPVANVLVPVLGGNSAPTDFYLNLSPVSATVSANGVATYNVTVSSLGNFSGSVALTVSGQPGDATATFSQNPVLVIPGTSTLTITAGATMGTYPLTITGASGALSHTASATLVVANSSSASWVQSDSTTVGNWIGKYGAGGYDIVQYKKAPSYGTVTPAGYTVYTWATSTTDSRGLQTPDGKSRFASCYYSFTSFTVDVNLTDNNAHQVALYCVDWDGVKNNYYRDQTIQIFDRNYGTLLDTQRINSFTGGVYLVWNVKGPVTIKLTYNGNTQKGNAVLSGIFLGP